MRRPGCQRVGGVEGRRGPRVAFEQMRKAAGDKAWSTMLGKLDAAAFRKLYPFSPALVEGLVALSNSLQRERTAIKLLTELLVEHIEDLQVALFFDGDDDGNIDAGEYRGIRDGAGVVHEYESGDEDHRELREVRVTVVARTRGEDPDVLANPALANSVTQAVENREVGAVPDGFRRRSITLAVRPRNVDRYDPNKTEE